MISEIFLIGALAFPPIGFFKPPLTPADRAFFEFVSQISGNSLTFVKPKSSWDSITEAVFKIPKGGFIFIEEFGKLHDYFKERDFEYFPMMWRTYHIYRRRGAVSA